MGTSSVQHRHFTSVFLNQQYDKFHNKKTDQVEKTDQVGQKKVLHLVGMKIYLKENFVMYLVSH